MSKVSKKKVSLNKESGFDSLVSAFEKNLNKPWYEWLEVKTVFPRPGKQGLVGLLRNKEKKEDVYVFKISQYINYLVQHEYAVMKALNEVSNYCPHFCKAVGGIVAEVDSQSRKEGNPFEINSQYVIEKEVLLMEYLEKSSKLYNYVRSSRVEEDVLYSTVKQTLMAILIAQKKKGFTHYDLHSNNIMMKKCSRNLVMLYVIDEENQFLVSTRGSYPVIIDYGFSFIKDMNGGPLWPTLGHTDVGFMSSEFDPFADPKLFLVTISGEIYEKRGGRRSKKFKNIVKNTFGKLDIDWDSGWDTEEKSVAGFTLSLLRKFNDESRLFNDYDHYCVDILQTLIILPLEEQKIDNMDKSFITFLHEFSKIETEISTPFYCLYILKGIVDAARTVRSDYAIKSSREHAVNYFKLAVRERVDGVAKFCKLKEIHYERMLCSLLCFGRCLEGVFYTLTRSRMEQKNKEYEKLPLQSIEEIYAAIELNIEDDYEFNEDTRVMIVNCMKESCQTVKLDKNAIETMNNTMPISRGTELYKLL